MTLGDPAKRRGASDCSLIYVGIGLAFKSPPPVRSGCVPKRLRVQYGRSVVVVVYIARASHEMRRLRECLLVGVEGCSKTMTETPTSLTSAGHRPVC